MYRIQLTKNPYSKKPSGDFIGLVKPKYDDLIKFAVGKLRISKKKIRVFVCSNSPNINPGTEITKDMLRTVVIKQEGGILPDQFYNVIGTVATRNMEPNHILQIGDFTFEK